MAKRRKCKAELTETLIAKGRLETAIRDLDRLYRWKIKQLEKGEKTDEALERCIRFLRLGLKLDTEPFIEEVDSLDIAFQITWNYNDQWEKVYD